MANYTKIPLSASTDGLPIKIAVTGTPGTTLHTATSSSGVDSFDEVYIWAGSCSGSAINASVHFGTMQGDPVGQTVNVRVPSAYNGPVLVIPGWPVRNGVVITATASTGNYVNMYGFANRISSQSS